nr:putative ribonuclease H-like domain-containing protein [Tanacetum cinerariifolium]
MLTFGGQGTSTQVLLLMRALYSSHIACFQLESRRAWKGDLRIGDEMVGGGSGGGGDGGLIGGVGVVCGDGVDSGVGDVVCGVVCGVVDGGQCIDIHDDCKRTDKDRWCGTRGKFVRWKGVRITNASKRAKRHQGDQDVDAKGNDYCETIWIKINGAFIIGGEFTHFKPFGCHVTILNTSDHLGKFNGKVDESYIVGYSGLGHEWYFDLDYLTDNLGYTHDKANQYAGPQEAITNPVGTQDADSDSDYEEQVIIVPSYPSHNIQGTKPKGQEQRATSDAERLGLGFAKDTEELQKRASAKIVPPGSIPVPTGCIPVLFGDSVVSTDDVLVHTIKPSSVAQAFEDPSWVDAMQEEMQQFKFQNVWVLVDLPEGFVDPQHPKKVYKVVKALYGLHQAPRAWMATTPYEALKPKSKNEIDSPINVHLYRSMIDSLMYLTASRPDIMFSVSACSRNQVIPTTLNLEAVKNIFKYLKGQPKLGLWYPRESPFVLKAYSDSDYAGTNKDRKSTTGGYQFLGRRLISWQCKKQTIMATSSTKADLMVQEGGLVIFKYSTWTRWPYFDDKMFILVVQVFPLVLPEFLLVVLFFSYWFKDVVANDMTTAEQLIQFIKNQLATAQFAQNYRVFNSPMLHLLRVEMVINSPWIMPILGTKELGSPEQTTPDAAFSRDIPLICADFSSILVKTQSSRYVVHTGRVVVPSGRYIIPGGNVIIVSSGRLSLIPTGRVFSPGRIQIVIPE